MPIPRIVHQLWKTEAIPARWRDTVDSVRRYHKGWEYRLWTDQALDAHVRVNHPAFYAVFAGFNRQIMRVDAFRYVLMQDFGGLYCDLDYEFLRPFDYGNDELVLSLEYDPSYGDESSQVANYVFASVPGHDLWKDALAALQSRPLFAATPADVCLLTGPAFLTRVFLANQYRYSGVRVTPKPILSPRRVHGRRERKIYLNSGITFGFHHGWGSWRERLSLEHCKHKLAKWLGFEARRKRGLLLARSLGRQQHP